MNGFQSSLFATVPTEPKPAPVECEHPKGAVFLNRDLFTPRMINEVCGKCNAILSRYEENGIMPSPAVDPRHVCTIDLFHYDVNQDGKKGHRCKECGEFIPYK